MLDDALSKVSGEAKLGDFMKRVCLGAGWVQAFEFSSLDSLGSLCHFGWF